MPPTARCGTSTLKAAPDSTHPFGALAVTGFVLCLLLLEAALQQLHHRRFLRLEIPRRFSQFFRGPLREALEQ